jgi:type I restriction enzyme S subunit
MQIIENTHLKFVDFTQLVSWSSYALLGKNLIYTQKYSFVRIGDFLKRKKEQVQIEDGVLYKRPTIRINVNGISLRDEVDGKNIGTKNQFRIYKDQFLLSKIDARNGAFGVVPQELNKGIITGNFWTFDVDYSLINPHYLTLLTGTKEFQKLCQTASVGTTNRNYLQEDLFLNFEIPLPEISEQEKLLNNYENKIKQANLLEQKATDLESEIEKYLYRELGVKINLNSTKNSLLQLVNFEETNRWDTLFLLGKIPTLKSKYPLVNFSEAIKFFNKDCNNKSIRVDSSKFPNEEFRYIGMEHIEKETGRLIDMPLVKGKEIKSQTIRVPKDFIVYGKLRPYLNKYWINQTEFDNIICSSEFFVFDIENGINKLFFKNVLSSKIIQDQISDKTSGARMPRINEEIFFNLQFPLPPIEVQNEIALNISNLISNIENSKLDAVNLRLEAGQEFENAIFS